MSKACRTCKEIKDEDQYGLSASGKTRNNYRIRKKTYKTQCKSCDAEYARAFRRKNKGYRGSGKIARYADRALSSAISVKLIEARHRSKKSSMPLDVDKDYLMSLYQKQEGKCVYTQEPLSITPKRPNTLSLDKVNPKLGYIQGNVQWVCWAVNRAKGDLEEHIFLKMCRVITEKCNDYPGSGSTLK